MREVAEFFPTFEHHFSIDWLLRALQPGHIYKASSSTLTVAIPTWMYDEITTKCQALIEEAAVLPGVS
jgi:hypothetical protein